MFGYLEILYIWIAECFKKNDCLQVVHDLTKGVQNAFLQLQMLLKCNGMKSKILVEAGSRTRWSFSAESNTSDLFSSFGLHGRPASSCLPDAPHHKDCLALMSNRLPYTHHAKYYKDKIYKEKLHRCRHLWLCAHTQPLRLSPRTLKSVQYDFMKYLIISPRIPQLLHFR